MDPHVPFGTLSNEALLAKVKHLAAAEAEATAALVASLIELDARRLYLGEGYSSLFTFCTRALGLSEHAAYRRIEAARAAGRFPPLLERLARSEITLTAIGLLAAHLTEANHVALIDAARHKSKQEVAELVAGLCPKPDVPAFVRKLPSPRPVIATAPSAAALPAAAPTLPGSIRLPSEPVAAAAAAPAAPVTPTALPPPVRPPTVLMPIGPERYKLQLTISAATRAKLRHAQDLLRHVVPDGDLAVVFDRALTALVAELEKKKLAATTSPPSRCGAAATGRIDRAAERSRTAAEDEIPSLKCGPQSPERPPNATDGGDASCQQKHLGPRRSRHIPAAVRRAVWARGQGRCEYTSATGHRCEETGRLEYHHLVPFACGGRHDVAGIQLRCRRHNQHEGLYHLNQ